MTEIVVKTIKKTDFLKGKYNILVPTNIFLDRESSILEALVEYLKEEYKLKYTEIGKLTNRDQRNIRTIYLRIKNKRIERGKIQDPNSYFPLSIVKDRSKSIFESIIIYLREQGASNKTLSIIFNRSTKTISTVYNRAKKK